MSIGVEISPAYFTAVKEAHDCRGRLVSLLDAIAEVKHYSTRFPNDDRIAYIMGILNKGVDNACHG